MKSRIKRSMRASRTTQGPKISIESPDHNLYNYTFEIPELDQKGTKWEIELEQDKSTYLPDCKFLFQEE